MATFRSAPIPSAFALALLLMSFSTAGGAETIRVDRATTDEFKQIMKQGLEAKRSHDWATAQQSYERAIGLSADFDENDPRRATALEELAGVQTTLGRPEQAIELLGMALEIRSASAPETVTLAAVVGKLAQVHQRLDETETAEQLYRRELALRERLQGPDHRALAPLLFRLGSMLSEIRPEDSEGDRLIERFAELQPSGLRYGRIARHYASIGEHERALEYHDRGLVFERREEEPDSSQVVQLLTQKAFQARELGQLDLAESTYYEAINLQEQLLGESHPRLAGTLERLIDLYLEQERYVEAEPLAVRTMIVKQTAWGECHECTRSVREKLTAIHEALGQGDDQFCGAEEPAVQAAAPAFGDPATKESGGRHPVEAELGALERQADALTEQGRHERAVALAVRALESRKRLFGPESLEAAEGLAHLGKLYENQRRLKEASDAYAGYLAALERELPADDPRIPAVLHRLGRLAQRQRDYEAAESYFLREIELREATGQDMKVSWVLETVARLNRTRNQDSAAEDYFVRAAELWEEMAGSQAPEIVNNMTGLAEAYIAQRKYDQAEALLLEMLARLEEQNPVDSKSLSRVLRPLEALYRETSRTEAADQVRSRQASQRAVRTR